ncbi:ribonuclease E/G [Formicincola oecophyllae]|uniref:Ribonuclease G n=1 Tax=Formicincola oecophyllae TaxID=2558361 RepID=A0A4Y6UBI5_9PROT|nr:ribonuclease E/G [Formicincola oecophyllae]QDH13836.1 ribonuclease E/G [Formicincola oecophyllae]
MTKHMLIDATHAEETRVVVMDGKRIEEYDVETASRRQLKGNIYLGRVIRIEPSLQAAFVDYGGNRHGFLPFSEIHPDYFQMPDADRAMLAALQAEDRREAEDQGNASDNDEGPSRAARFLRNYKIQEVIRRRQPMLVQIVKDERGNKGASLTTCLSLAGRYCVFMPNALKPGGVSRKISSESDRRRLRDAISSLELPDSMAMIVRTAGAGQPSPEIVRDCDVLLQLWEDIRQRALEETAPALIYEEASLVKRAVRDMFTPDVADVTVDGEEAWNQCRAFAQVLMPNQAAQVKLWPQEGNQPLFAHHNVESRLDAMFSPTVQLESGGYIVINQTEALVAIDVNSGKSTSQRNVEDTAISTNLEAADEIARQLRLRDLAGLVVIDFIDMESSRHRTQVEKRLKDALRNDKARLQVGKISSFGLLEMSRQRLRPSLAENVFSTCPRCSGTGRVRSVESAALHVLRALDKDGAANQGGTVTVSIAPDVALYLLNAKRDHLDEIEQRHGLHVIFAADSGRFGESIQIERGEDEIVVQLDGTSAAASPRAESAGTPQEGRSSSHRTAPAAHERIIDVENTFNDAPPKPSPAPEPTRGKTSEAPSPAQAEGADAEPPRQRERGGRRRRSERQERPQERSEQQPAEQRPNRLQERPEGRGRTAPTPSADNGYLMPGMKRTRTRRLNDAPPAEEVASKAPAAEATNPAAQQPAPQPQRAPAAPVNTAAPKPQKEEKAAAPVTPENLAAPKPLDVDDVQPAQRRKGWWSR